MQCCSDIVWGVQSARKYLHGQFCSLAWPRLGWAEPQKRRKKIGKQYKNISLIFSDFRLSFLVVCKLKNENSVLGRERGREGGRDNERCLEGNNLLILFQGGWLCWSLCSWCWSIFSIPLPPTHPKPKAAVILISSHLRYNKYIFQSDRSQS